MSTIYLSGGIHGCTDSEASDWRKYAAKKLVGCGHTCMDPFREDFRGREKDFVDYLVEQDKEDIETCDILLVYFVNNNHIYAGTCMEILYAWQLDKEVVVVSDQFPNMSPWIYYHSDKQFTSLDEAIEYICD